MHQFYARFVNRTKNNFQMYLPNTGTHTAGGRRRNRPRVLAVCQREERLVRVVCQQSHRLLHTQP